MLFAGYRGDLFSVAEFGNGPNLSVLQLCFRLL